MYNLYHEMQAAARLWREELQYSPSRLLQELQEKRRHQRGEAQGPEQQLALLLDVTTARHHKKFKAEMGILLRKASNNLEIGYHTQNLIYQQVEVFLSIIFFCCRDPITATISKLCASSDRMERLLNELTSSHRSDREGRSRVPRALSVSLFVLWIMCIPGFV